MRALFTNAVFSQLFVFLSNFLGNPAVSVPNGYCPTSGLPTGFHVMARQFADDDALFLAQMVEGTVKIAKPKVFFDVVGGK